MPEPSRALCAFPRLSSRHTGSRVAAALALLLPRRSVYARLHPSPCSSQGTTTEREKGTARGADWLYCVDRASVWCPPGSSLWIRPSRYGPSHSSQVRGTAHLFLCIASHGGRTSSLVTCAPAHIVMLARPRFAPAPRRARLSCRLRMRLLDMWADTFSADPETPGSVLGWQYHA